MTQLDDSIIQNIVAPLDDALVTPANNLVMGFELDHQLSYPGPDVSHPYSCINDSPNAVAIKSGVLIYAVLSIMGNFVAQRYRKFRKEEALSSYFIFEKLPDIKAFFEKQMLKQSAVGSFGMLAAAAYYYNAELPVPVLRWRRFWATLTRSRQYLNLKKYLQQQLQAGKTKKASLERIDQEINETLATYINEKKDIYGEWVAEKKSEKWIVRLENPPKASHNSPDPCEIKEQKNKTFTQQVWQFIEARINEFGKAGYVFWVCVFIFFLLPGVGVTAALVGAGLNVLPPILISLGFLLGIWMIKSFKKPHDQKPPQTLLNENVIPPNVAKLSLENIAQHLKIAALLQEKTNVVSTKLHQEMKKIVQKRANMIFVGAFLNGFVSGLITISLVSWLLFSAIGAIVTIPPLGMFIVAVATLVFGISWGIYSAWKHFKAQDAQLNIRVQNLAKLKNVGEIPNMSLREYDRTFRRGQTHATAWTKLKQISKRLWVAFLGVGTGIFILKITGYGVANAFLAMVIGGSASVAFLPLAGIFLTGGLLYAAWSLYRYHLESQEAQMDRVLNTLTHPLFNENKQQITVTYAIAKNVDKVDKNAKSKQSSNGVVAQKQKTISKKSGISSRSPMDKVLNTLTHPLFNENKQQITVTYALAAKTVDKVDKNAKPKQSNNAIVAQKQKTISNKSGISGRSPILFKGVGLRRTVSCPADLNYIVGVKK